MREVFLLIIVKFLLIVKILASSDHPNLLIMMSDDQSFPHASAYGSKMISTPNFDKVAKEGVLLPGAQNFVKLFT